MHRFCSGLLALLLLFVAVTPCRAAEGFGGGSFGGGAGRSDFFTWTNGFGGGSYGGGAGRDDAAAAYTDYVNTLPADNINSQGQSRFYPTGWTYETNANIFSIDFSSPDFPWFSSHTENGDWDPKVTLRAAQFQVPASGNYRIVIPVPSVEGGTYKADEFYYLYGSNPQDESKWHGKKFKHGESVLSVLDSSFLYTLSFGCTLIPSSPGLMVTYKCDRPYIEGVFTTSSDTTTYNTTTRPTSISGGNYGVVGDNNEITKVEDNSTIINETNNTYYNPATGTTVPITDWSYNYTDRSYNVTTETGDTATITYGDENISIQETNTTSGDTVTNNYTIYYLVEDSGSGDTPADPPAACTHEWTETSSTPATCTVPGSKLLTCSLCSQTKTESIPVLGHDWETKQTVTTQYDDTGQLTQQGYTVFECGTCHEQYKSEDGSLPPAVTPGTGTDLAVVDALKEKLKIAADALLGIFDKLPELFTGFTDFLAAVFPFVPTEFITIFELGLFLLIAAAALRKFLS